MITGPYDWGENRRGESCGCVSGRGDGDLPAAPGGGPGGDCDRIRRVEGTPCADAICSGVGSAHSRMSGEPGGVPGDFGEGGRITAVNVNVEMKGIVKLHIATPPYYIFPPHQMLAAAAAAAGMGISASSCRRPWRLRRRGLRSSLTSASYVLARCLVGERNGEKGSNWPKPFTIYDV